ncbi:MAG: hypothetical protein O7F71_04850 [Gammaproteobacteria bacterium]|nr:hypothetical protein [Gammaproteobacteria bacterium]
MNGSGVMIRYNSPMDGMYQLVFSGEVSKGQHRGVVKRRLRESLNLSEAQVDKLFTGEPAIVKGNVDEATAEKYQELFEKAGAKLQAVPVEEAAEAASAATVPEESQAPDSDVADVGATIANDSEEVPDADFEVAEVGSDMLIEPTVVVATEVNDVDFDVAEVGADIGDRDDRPPPPAPDVSHIKLVD